MTTLEKMGERAKACARVLATAGSLKNRALLAVAEALESRSAEILAANALDIENGTRNNMTQSLLDRLTLNEERIKGMADGVRQVVALPDPVGTVLDGHIHSNGMKITKIRVPLGVIGIIFEARPNVTSDAAALCLKAGNAVILRGGKEALHSNTAIATVMRGAVESAGLPADSIQLIEDTRRESAVALMGLSHYLDVLIPRGGAGLIRTVVENAKVPVIETGTGNCHVYVDASADLSMAADIIYNAKTDRPSVCNAIETVLVHTAVAESVLPLIREKLDRKQVELRGCDRTRAILGDRVNPVTEEDYATEFLDYILAVRVVDSLEDALAHINRYSSGHSECIVTERYEQALRFTDSVDAAAVYVNASTRFTDGGVFGLGAEIGISTQKLHARGPMGLNELTSMKYVVQGTGQVR